MLLVSGATKTVNAIADRARLGALIVPRSGNIPPADRPWALDNDAYNGFDAPRFERMLARLQSRAREALWCSAPDVVADADATRALFAQWEPKIHALGYPVAYVVQNGETVDRCPWDSFEALFVGGKPDVDDGPDWKLSPQARALVDEAKRRGKRTHMGRVNSRRRMRIAFEWGVDSVDGTSLSRFSERWIPWALRYLRNLERQEAMPWLD